MTKFFSKYIFRFKFYIFLIFFFQILEKTSFIWKKMKKFKFWTKIYPISVCEVYSLIVKKSVFQSFVWIRSDYGSNIIFV